MVEGVGLPGKGGERSGGVMGLWGMFTRVYWVDLDYGVYLLTGYLLNAS